MKFLNLKRNWNGNWFEWKVHKRFSNLTNPIWIFHTIQKHWIYPKFFVPILITFWLLLFAHLPESNSRIMNFFWNNKVSEGLKRPRHLFWNNNKLMNTSCDRGCLVEVHFSNEKFVVIDEQFQWTFIERRFYCSLLDYRGKWLW